MNTTKDLANPTPTIIIAVNIKFINYQSYMTISKSYQMQYVRLSTLLILLPIPNSQMELLSLLNQPQQTICLK